LGQLEWCFGLIIVLPEGTKQDYTFLDSYSSPSCILPEQRYASAGICYGNSVCLCVTRVLCIKMAAWIELIFCMQVSFDLFYNVF